MKRLISIHGAPRSGTSWLGQIFDSAPETNYKFQPLFSLSFKDAVHVRSSVEEIEAYLSELYQREDDYLDANYQKDKGIYPVFEKKLNPSVLVTKMVRYHYMAEPFLKLTIPSHLVFIIRNPCAVIDSWAKASEKEYLPEWNLEEHWYYAQGKNEFRPEEYYGFHRWKELSKMALTLKTHCPEKVHIVQYEELSANPLEQVEQMFAHCQLDMDEQTVNFINQSKSDLNEDYYSVFKANKNVHSWKETLPQYIIDTIYSELKNTDLEQFLK
ncbi:MAG: sulfotransferase [Schleiferiaceae bacterium]|nr:sulfotransferase [Schleiferiaceae bacterium]